MPTTTALANLPPSDDSRRFLVKWCGCANCGELVGQAYDTHLPDCPAVTAWLHDTYEHEHACWYAAPISLPLGEMMAKYLAMRNPDRTKGAT